MLYTLEKKVERIFAPLFPKVDPESFAPLFPKLDKIKLISKLLIFINENKE
jgi:hypothetical protein